MCVCELLRYIPCIKDYFIRRLPEEKLTNAVELVRFYKREIFCSVLVMDKRANPSLFFAGSLAAGLPEFLALQLREMYYVH